MTLVLAFVLGGALALLPGLLGRGLGWPRWRLPKGTGAGRPASGDNEQRLRHALDAADAGTWEWDLATNRNLWSDEVFRLYGLPPRSVEPSYDAWLNAVRPEDRLRAAATVQSALRHLAELNLEWRPNAPQVSERWLLSRGKPEIDGSGKPQRFRGIVMDITHRKRAEQALTESEQRYRTAFQTSPDAITINRVSDGLYLDVNEGFSRQFGWAPKEVVGRTSQEIRIWQSPQSRKQFIDILQRDGQCRNLETTLLSKDGQTLTVLVSSRVIKLHGEDCILTFTRDISDRKIADSQLRKLSQAVEQSPESIIITNLAAQIEYVNAAFCRISGYSSAEVLGKTPQFLDTEPGGSAAVVELRAAMQGGMPWQGELQNRRKDGSEYTEFAIVAPIRREDGEVTNFVAVQQDITERVQAQKRIQHLAYFDQLTGLPNRTLLLDRLRQATLACARVGAHGILMMIDLDNFKLLNDTLGHDVGDQLLRQVAGRISACVRRGDTLARLGGDEFMVVVTGLVCTGPDAATFAQTIAGNILTALQTDFQLGAVAHHCSASIGVTLFNDEFVSNDELVKQAELAMYKAKESGRETVRFFDPQMEAAVRQRSVVEKELRRGLAEQQFVLQYQPQVDAAGRILGVEALVRWRHPARGLVLPAEFIPVAEESGLILSLGSAIFSMAFAQIAAWSTRAATAGLQVAVNLSARQIRRPDFVEQVLDGLRAAGADPRRLKLELTESLLIENTEDIIEKMTALKDQGVGFSLDDFGTGFSSLSYLKRLPLDQLKIDQSFVRDVFSDPDDAAIARTIIALADRLGLGVIAEGVETEAQREFLAAAGCGAFQGYLFGRPMFPEALEKRLESQPGPPV